MLDGLFTPNTAAAALSKNDSLDPVLPPLHYSSILKSILSCTLDEWSICLLLLVFRRGTGIARTAVRVCAHVPGVDDGGREIIASRRFTLTAAVFGSAVPWLPVWDRPAEAWKIGGIKVHNPFEGIRFDPLGDARKQLQNFANKTAAQVKDSGQVADYNACVVMVAAACAAYGAKSGGPLGAALGAGGGSAAAGIACRRVFPE